MIVIHEEDMGLALKVASSIREPRCVTRNEKQSPEVAGFSLKQSRVWTFLVELYTIVY